MHASHICRPNMLSQAISSYLEKRGTLETHAGSGLVLHHRWLLTLHLAAALTLSCCNLCSLCSCITPAPVCHLCFTHCCAGRCTYSISAAATLRAEAYSGAQRPKCAGGHQALGAAADGAHAAEEALHVVRKVLRRSSACKSGHDMQYHVPDELPHTDASLKVHTGTCLKLSWHARNACVPALQYVA